MKSFWDAGSTNSSVPSFSTTINVEGTDRVPEEKFDGLSVPSRNCLIDYGDDAYRPA
jgi:hypothetical protein